MDGSTYTYLPKDTSGEQPYTPGALTGAQSQESYLNALYKARVNENLPAAYQVTPVDAGTATAETVEAYIGQVAEAYGRYAQDVQTEANAYKNTAPEGAARQEEINKYVDHAISKSRFVENPLIVSEKVEDLFLGEVSLQLEEEIRAEYGVDISGYAHVLTDNDIRHIFNRHGPHTPESIPVTAEDIKAIPQIINNANEVYYVPRSDGKAGIVYQYRHNGVTYYVEQIVEAEKKLRNKQMIKVPTGVVPDIKGLKAAMEAKSTDALPGDAANAVPQMYVQDVKPGAFTNTIPQKRRGVNTEYARDGSPDAIDIMLGEGGSNGREIFDRNRGRAPGTRTGGEAGVLGGSGSRAAAEQGRKATDRQAAGQALQQVSAAELGVAWGTERQSAKVFPEELWDQELQETAARVREATGREPTFVLGPLEIWKQGGGTALVRGYIAGSRILIQADSLRVSASQIADHEIFHYLEENNPGLRQAVEDAIIERYRREELDAALERYARGLRGIVDIEEYASQMEQENWMWDLERELFADAYAGINSFSTHAERYKDTVEQVMEDRGVGLPSQTAAATDRRRGPPAGQYSIANTRDLQWEDQVRRYFQNDGTIKSSDSLYLGESNVNGVQASPRYVPTSVITKAIRPSKGSRSAHALTQTDILKLSEGIDNAPVVIHNPTRNALVYVTENQDANGNYIIAAFDLNNNLHGENAHKATSIHGRENLVALLEHLDTEATIHVRDENKLNQMLPGNQILKSLELLAKVELDNGSITRNNAESKGEFSQMPIEEGRYSVDSAEEADPFQEAMEILGFAEGRYSIDPDYAGQIEAWEQDGRPQGETFILGATGDVLQGLGAMEQDIYLRGDKINKILDQHPEMTLAEIKRIPEILDDPVLVLKSIGAGARTENTRMVLFGTVRAENGQPVMAVLDLRPIENGLAIESMQKVNSAYTKDKGAASFIQRSEIMYADKKRTTPLLRSIGLTIASRPLLRSGSLGSITYQGGTVNLKGVPFWEVVSMEKEHYSVEDDPFEEAMELMGFGKADGRGQGKKGRGVPGQVNKVDNAKGQNYTGNRNGGGGSGRSEEGSAGQLYGTSGEGVWAGRDGDGHRPLAPNRAIRNGRGNLQVSGIVLLSPESQSILTRRGVVNVELQDYSGDNAAFSFALDDARAADKEKGWAVTPKTARELDESGARTFMDAKGATGFAIAPDGDIEAVFANRAAGAPKGATKSTMPQAIALGGTKLDCYGEGLVDLYCRYGFVPVARVAFKAEEANPGWVPGMDTPDIYFMLHNGDSADTVVRNMGQYKTWTKAELDALPLMDYNAAYAYRDSLMNGGGPGGPQDTGYDLLRFLTDPDYRAQVEEGEKRKAPAETAERSDLRQRTDQMIAESYSETKTGAQIADMGAQSIQSAREAIRSGAYPLTINPEKQMRHMDGASTIGRSRITISMDELQEIVRQTAGFGRMGTTKSGEWDGKEIIDAGKVIGYTINRENVIMETTKAKIHYSKTGTHVVPYSGR